MNISGMLRGVLGEAKAQEPKTLELKVGQVVKGTVMQTFSDNEALVNIGGVQVRAKLEAPLKQGEATMLQVQPESSGGQVILKPLQASQVPISDSSMADLLKMSALSDTPENRQLLQMLHSSGIDLTKENVQAFSQLQARMPSNILQEEWVPAAIIAFQKGLPLTAETVQSLRQAVQGPPFHEMLDQIHNLMGREVQGGKELSPQTKALIETVRMLVQQVKEAGSQMIVPRAEGAAASGSSVGAGGASQQQAGVAAQQQAGAAASGSSAGAGVAAQQQAGAAASGSSAGAGGAAQQQAGAAASGGSAGAGGAAQQQAGAAASGGSAGAAASGSSAGAGGAAQQQAGAAASGSSAGASGAAQQQAGAAASGSSAVASVAAQQQASPDNKEVHLLGRMMKAIGIEHEQHAMKLLANSDLPVRLEGDGKSTDSLKSVLMQLAQAPDASNEIKQAAQQAVQQITGQQLLLSQDRTALFSHVTLFVPIVQQDGTQTAAVHIQSRRGKNGALDSSNCRLVFDLRMKALGDTLVDVQVIDRIVSLHVHNDMPFVQELLETNRNDIETALANVGYQFISMKISPYPERLSDINNEGNGASLSSEAGGTTVPPLYSQKPYKGVDIRV